MFYVYVLKSDSGILYIGQTSNLAKRILEHNSGLSKFTKRGRYWSLVYSEELTTRSKAMLREKWFKTGVGREFLMKNISSRA